MSREIRFRAWDGRRYHYSGELFFQCLKFDGGEPLAGSYDQDISFDICGDDIEQFTGISDQHGTPIYEGDKVVANGSETVHIIEDIRSIMLTNEPIFDQEMYGDGIGSEYMLTVVGNIHE